MSCNKDQLCDQDKTAYKGATVKKFLKVIWILLILAIIIRIVAVTFLVILIDPSHYKKQIEQIVYHQTGKEITIAGDVKWVFFPGIKIQINDVTLKNPPGFRKNIFATAKKIDFDVSLFPLLAKTITTKKIAIDHLSLNLELDKEKRPFWQHVLYQKQTALPPPKIEMLSKIMFFRQMLAISAIEITNGNIAWDDAVKKTHFSLNNLNLTAETNTTRSRLIGHLKAGEADVVQLVFNDVSADFSLEKGLITCKDITAKIHGGKFKGQITINLQGEVPFYLVDGKLSNVSLHKLLDAFGIAKKIEGSINATLKLHTYGMQKKTSLLNNLNGTGQLKTKAEFGNLSGLFSIKNGVLSNSDLLIISSDYQIIGKGTLNLVTQAVNYDLKVYPTNWSSFIPLKITGTFNNIQK